MAPKRRMSWRIVMSALLSVTDKAKNQLEGMEVTHDNFLRLWVGEGGCSGLSYQAVIDNAATPFDVTLYEDEMIRIVTDGQSKEYLEGITIDYSDDLVKSGFRFLNPRASQTCGCGGSFKA